MIQVNEIAFFCYPVTDMTRSRKFYEEALGLKPTYIAEKETGKWVEYDIGSTTLSIGQAPGWTPSSEGGNVALEVADFDQAVADLKSKQVPLCHGAFRNPGLSYGNRQRS